MQLTKNHKKYIGILGACLLALLVDRLLLSPSEAEAEEPAVRLLVPPPAGGLDPAPAGDADDASRGRTTTLAARFQQVAEEHALDPLASPDAFRAPRDWFRDDPEVVAPIETDSRKERFLRQHELSGVMANAGRGFAIIDGRKLRVGDALDGFLLVSVNARSAVFEGHGGQVELKLNESR